MEQIQLAENYKIPRLIRGTWQLSAGHGDYQRQQALQDFVKFVDHGFDVVDCADIYTGVEQLIGEVRKELPQLRVHTKCVPDLASLSRVNRHYIRNIVTRSLTRLASDCLDLVQFHWWDYQIPGAAEALHYLQELQQEGLIRNLGLTNFDGSHTDQFLQQGLPLLTTQVQYSLLDRRAESDLRAICQRHNVQLLCYGALAGGFISERWHGVSQPTALANRSQVKYQLIIEDFGGWRALQHLLDLLAQISHKHQVSIASVALRWLLDQPMVAAVIVGARYATHLDSLLEVDRLRLDDEDRYQIRNFLNQHPGPSAAVFAAERNRDGKHGRIMHYNLNCK